MEMSDFVTISADGDLAIVAVDRPPANALSPELLAEGRDAVRELERLDPAGVVLHGRPGFFSAGLDLKVTPTLDEAGQRPPGAAVHPLVTPRDGVPRARGRAR